MYFLYKNRKHITATKALVLSIKYESMMRLLWVNLLCTWVLHSRRFVTETKQEIDVFYMHKNSSNGSQYFFQAHTGLSYVTVKMALSNVSIDTYFF